MTVNVAVGVGVADGEGEGVVACGDEHSASPSAATTASNARSPLIPAEMLSPPVLRKVKATLTVASAVMTVMAVLY
jgi:hypothetical protein